MILRTDFPSVEFVHVITSYSIHYTKLYDDVQILRALKREFDGLFRELELIPRIFQDPREALDFMTNDREGTAVLISDQKMPEMSGSDLIARATALDRDIVSILLTAYSDISYNFV